MCQISIIVPTYNASQYLPRCLDSIINQTFDNLEIIIVNDGSTDNSSEILKKYQTQNPKLIILDQKNSGQSVARNNGLQVAHGKYIMFVDSDDWLEPDICERLYQEIVDGDNDIAICGINNYYNDQPTEEHNLRLFSKNKFIPNFIVVPFGKLYKASYWKHNEFKFHEGIFYEDFDLLPRVLFLTDKIKFLDVPLYNYERRNQNSTTNIRKKSDYMFLILDRLYDFYKQQRPNHNFEVFYLQHIFHQFYTYDHVSSRKQINDLINSKRQIIKLENCVNINQKIIATLILLRIPLRIIWFIVEIRSKIFRNKS